MELTERGKELRKKVLDLALETGEAHIGGAFSEIEILLALFDSILKPEDKFILSKGHACYPLYILLREKGCNPKIQGHPDLDEKNCIYCTTGSLGHGLPMGIGMAFARKIKSKPGKIYVLLGDGECHEGTTWESSLIANHHKLDNLVVIVDYNKLQALDKTDNILSFGDIKKKFKSFGFHVAEINGHNIPEIITALKTEAKDKPCLIIANTIKGAGISYMENNPLWHGRRPTQERLQQAYEELK